MITALRRKNDHLFWLFYRMALLHFPYFFPPKCTEPNHRNDTYTHFLRGLHSALNGDRTEYVYRVENLCKIPPADRVHVDVLLQGQSKLGCYKAIDGIIEHTVFVARGIPH